MHIHFFDGGNALSDFRVRQLLPRLQAVVPAVERIAARHVHLAGFDVPPAAAELERLGNALQDEVLRLRGLLTGGSSTASAAALQAQFALSTAAARAGDRAALEALPGISQALEQSAQATAVTAVDVARMRAWLSASLSDTLRSQGLTVPSFDVGTNYVPRDMLAQVHEGEAIVPRAYNPAAGGRAQADAALLQEMKALRAEVVNLRYETRAVATHTHSVDRTLKRVTPDGDALATRPGEAS